MRPLLAMDFDGVICDSIHECLHTSWTAWQMLCTEKNIQVPAEMTEQWRMAFFEHRHLVRLGPEFLLLWNLLTRDQEPKQDQALRQQVPTSEADYERMVELFYSARKRTAHEAAFFSCYNKLYDGMLPCLERLAARDDLFIVSSKDVASIDAILRFNGLVLPHERILGRERGDKKALLLDLASQHPDRQIIFIDDCIENLQHVSTVPVQKMLASWGYVSPGANELAVRLGAQPCTLPAFLAMFGGAA